ncbi:hypothetical protein ACOTD3_31520, partial [Achromobacter dolens]
AAMFATLLASLKGDTKLCVARALTTADEWIATRTIAPGAHKVNNCIGQALLAKRMGKPRVIAETGAGQHGVAT